MTERFINLLFKILDTTFITFRWILDDN